MVSFEIKAMRKGESGSLVFSFQELPARVKWGGSRDLVSNQGRQNHSRGLISELIELKKQTISDEWKQMSTTTTRSQKGLLHLVIGRIQRNCVLANNFPSNLFISFSNI
jgi:hypothetical protein